jgi:glutamate formiminotransferase
MPSYTVRVGSTNGAYNVQYEDVEAKNEEDAIAIVRKKYTYPEATFQCRLDPPFRPEFGPESENPCDAMTQASTIIGNLDSK